MMRKSRVKKNHSLAQLKHIFFGRSAQRKTEKVKQTENSTTNKMHLWHLQTN